MKQALSPFLLSLARQARFHEHEPATLLTNVFKPKLDTDVIVRGDDRLKESGVSDNWSSMYQLGRDRRAIPVNRAGD